MKLKAISRACRLFLLAYVPIGCFSPLGMRFLDASGVRPPWAGLILLTVLVVVPFLGITLWVFSAQQFWDRLLERSAAVRFAMKWATPVCALEAVLVLLVMITVKNCLA